MKRPRKRASEASAVLTSSPHKRALEKKAAARQNKVIPKKFGSKGKNAKKPSNHQDEDAECLYCSELFSISGGDWIRCEGCQKWAHTECSNEVGGEFICEICME